MSEPGLMQQITLQVFAWGNNSLGQLGLNDTANRRAPAPVEALWAIPVAQLAAGEAHSAALTINGFLFTWGHNEKGQLGLAAGADAVAQARVVSSTQARLHFTPRPIAHSFIVDIEYMIEKTSPMQEPWHLSTFLA